MYVVCEDHLHEAIDEFVEVYEQCPDIYRLDQVSFTDWSSPHNCDMCADPPKYLVV